jgi:hypothetical protein
MFGRAAIRGVWLAVLLTGTALANSVSTSQTLTVSIGAVTLVSVNPVTMSTSGGTFDNAFQGSVLLSYKVRTNVSGGSAKLQLKATADFTPAGGPSIASPPSPGDVLTYNCTSASLGTNCTGSPTVSTTSLTDVFTVGAGACTGTGCTGSNPQTQTLTFQLTNDPQYSTGTYQATLTFTASAV